MMSTEQKIVLRKIANEQIEDLYNIKVDHAYEVYNELKAEDYELDVTDVFDECDKIINMWKRVYREPENFASILNSTNLGMLRHFLFNDHMHTTAAKGIWKRINLAEIGIDLEDMNLN